MRVGDLGVDLVLGVCVGLPRGLGCLGCCELGAVCCDLFGEVICGLVFGFGGWGCWCAFDCVLVALLFVEVLFDWFLCWVVVLGFGGLVGVAGWVVGWFGLLWF